MKNLILLEMNEINFDAVKFYIDAGVTLPGFEGILSGNFISTTSEREYELLEPWIQWPSIHTGASYAQHRVFRLGDIVSSEKEQIFEKVEQHGFTVGVISAMNASNKLKSPRYFIPDPWTKTLPDNSFFSKILHRAISQAVNDNSEAKITLRSIFDLALSFIFLVRVRRWSKLIGYAISTRGKSWRKALFLDMFLMEVHSKYHKKRKPNFSTLFLNAGAHIQHHYFYNSKLPEAKAFENPDWYIEQSEDPFLEMLIVYDEILKELNNNDSYDFIVATGLSQKVHERIKYYYRLKNHENFLDGLGLNFKSVEPRMTRDFLIKFSDSESAKLGEKILLDIHLNGDRLFGEIDNRGRDLFVVLTYDKEITQECAVYIDGMKILMSEFVNFVAIKNGEHQSKGYAFFSERLQSFSPSDKSNIIKIHNCIEDYFIK